MLINSVTQCVHDFASNGYGLPLSMLMAGFLGGMTHCSTMCAPMVLAQTKNYDDMQMKKAGGWLSAPYHLGRMTTYVLLAVVLHMAVAAVFVRTEFTSLIAAPLLMVAGLLFLVSAFPRLAMLFPWVARAPSLINSKVYSRIMGAMMRAPKWLSGYGLGVLLGFMPCGLLLSALIAVSTLSSSVMVAAFSMAAFTIGTMPTLMAVAWGGRAFMHRYPELSKGLTQGAMIISSLWLFALAGSMFF